MPRLTRNVVGYIIVALFVMVAVYVFVFVSPNVLVIPREEIVSIPEIICEPEDLRDSPFIQTVKRNATVHIPATEVLESLRREELSALYHRYVNNIQYLCKNKIRLGMLDDGGWDACADSGFIQSAPCLVYSFGINNDFSFDDDVVRKLNCEVHSFDPSMNKGDHKRGEKSYFHNLGLAGVDMVNRDGWSLKKLSTIRSELGHNDPAISILKIDIETWELEALETMISQGDLFKVKQITTELHLQVLSPEQDRHVYFRALNVLRDLYQLGFRMFSTHTNPWCTFVSKCKKEMRSNCNDVSFVRVN